MPLGHYHRVRLLLLLASLAAIGVFAWAGATFDVPAFTDRSPSLLGQPWPFVAIMITLVATVASVLLGTLLAGTVRFDAGLVAAGIGLGVFAVHGGPMRYAIMHADGPRVFLRLAAELVLLYVVLIVAWGVLWVLFRKGWLRDDPELDGVLGADETLGNRVMALLTHALVTIIVVLLIAQTDDKAQVLAAVFVGTFIASVAAHHLFPTRPSIWYWGSPLIVGLLGYVLAYAGSDLWMIGVVGGYAPGLGRPTPLDYASAGTAGSVIGYWMSRRWQRQQDEEAIEEGKVVDASA